MTPLLIHIIIIGLIIVLMLEGLEGQGATKRFISKENKELWGLTKIGKLINENNK